MFILAYTSAEIELPTKSALHRVLPCSPRDEGEYPGLLDARW